MEHTDKQKEREGNRLRPRTLTAHDFAWVCVCALFLSLSLPVLCCAFRECQRVKVCHRYTTRVVTTTKRLQYNRRVVLFFFSSIYPSSFAIWNCCWPFSSSTGFQRRGFFILHLSAVCGTRQNNVTNDFVEGLVAWQVHVCFVWLSPLFDCAYPSFRFSYYDMASLFISFVFAPYWSDGTFWTDLPSGKMTKLTRVKKNNTNNRTKIEFEKSFFFFFFFLLGIRPKK